MRDSLEHRRGHMRDSRTGTLAALSACRLLRDTRDTRGHMQDRWGHIPDRRIRGTRGHMRAWRRRLATTCAETRPVCPWPEMAAPCPRGWSYTLNPTSPVVALFPESWHREPCAAVVMYIYIHVYMYMYMCICTCICI